MGWVLGIKDVHGPTISWQVCPSMRKNMRNFWASELHDMVQASRVRICPKIYNGNCLQYYAYHTYVDERLICLYSPPHKCHNLLLVVVFSHLFVSILSPRKQAYTCQWSCSFFHVRFGSMYLREYVDVIKSELEQVI